MNNRNTIKHLFWLWLILLLLLNVLPINLGSGSDGQQLSDKKVFSLRLDYLIHITIFLPFAGIWLLGKKRGVRWFERFEVLKISLIVLVAAMGFEFLQMFTPWRTFNWVDMVYNVIGAAFSILVIAFSSLLATNNLKE